MFPFVSTNSHIPCDKLLTLSKAVINRYAPKLKLCHKVHPMFIQELLRVLWGELLHRLTGHSGDVLVRCPNVHRCALVLFHDIRQSSEATTPLSLSLQDPNACTKC